MKPKSLLAAASVFCIIVTNLHGQKMVNGVLLNYAKASPDSVELNFKDLAYYLKIPAKSEKEIVETIFYWVAVNIDYVDPSYGIEYDVDSLANFTLMTRKSGCEGTARLFKELCIAAGIECELIFGYAQGFGFDSKKVKRPNHSWNAVIIDGKPILVDATWGGGGATTQNGQLVHVKELDMRYLFSDPKNFNIDHLPEDPKWQLLDDPISKNEFYSDEWDLKRMGWLGW
ncbi:MAG: transglutaminase domain-containing protein [Bacteroidales bacterium]|jgi:transglutaminase/protease-like cytokinesis protein 3|nr:transglutaminase domain-containing protein [Bacteroidales bacterium]